MRAVGCRFPEYYCSGKRRVSDDSNEVIRGLNVGHEKVSMLASGL